MRKPKADASVLTAKAVFSTRLRNIRKMMNLTTRDFAELFGCAPIYICMLEDRKTARITLMHVRLAEYIYKEWLENKGKKVTSRDLPDAAIKSKIYVMSLGGKSRPDICRELALRPEIVDYLLDNIE